MRCGLMIRVADVQAWLNRLATQCQCCAQGKDVSVLRHGTVLCGRGVLSSGGVTAHNQGRQRPYCVAALHSAVSQQLIDRNVAQLAQIPKATQAQAGAMDE